MAKLHGWLWQARKRVEVQAEFATGQLWHTVAKETYRAARVDGAFLRKDVQVIEWRSGAQERLSAGWRVHRRAKIKPEYKDCALARAHFAQFAGWEFRSALEGGWR